MTSEKTELAIARADRVMRSMDERGGAARDAARRERQRLNAGLARALGRVGIAVIAVSLATIAFGLFVNPIGMFGRRQSAPRVQYQLGSDDDSLRGRDVTKGGGFIRRFGRCSGHMK